MFGQIAVLGVGLLGGSLGRACRKRGLAGKIVGYGRKRANLDAALKLGALDAAAASPAEAVKDADLVVLCSPVGSFAELVKTIAPALKPGALVTDVGSVKAAVVRDVEGALPDPARFVAAHPIAGGEKSGVEASDPELYDGALCILTPTPRTRPEALERVRGLWRALGMRDAILSPEDHDAIFGAVSHMPHVVAFALMRSIAGLRARDGKPFTEFCGNGFRDMTRIAASDPAMWRDICLANRDAILAELERFSGELARLRGWIQSGDGRALEQAFVEARERRSAL